MRRLERWILRTLRSCMTLFAEIAIDDSVFAQILEPIALV